MAIYRQYQNNEKCGENIFNNENNRKRNTASVWPSPKEMAAAHQLRNNEMASMAYQAAISIMRIRNSNRSGNRAAKSIEESLKKWRSYSAKEKPA